MCVFLNVPHTHRDTGEGVGGGGGVRVVFFFSGLSVSYISSDVTPIQTAAAGPH